MAPTPKKPLGSGNWCGDAVLKAADSRKPVHDKRVHSADHTPCVTAFILYTQELLHSRKTRGQGLCTSDAETSAIITAIKAYLSSEA
eukprot:6422-Heterococcus_DN1.PRE.3